MIRTAFALLAASLLVHASGALAQAPANATVRVLDPECASAIDRDALVRLLASELRGDGVDRVTGSDDAPEDVAQIEIVVDACERPDSARVRIDDRATRKRVERVVDLREVAESLRARTLAIAIAELLRASWLELAMPEPPEPAVEVSPAIRERAVDRMARALDAPLRREPPRATAAEPPARSNFAFGIATTARVFPGTGLAVFGARVPFTTGLFDDAMYVRADLGLQGGIASDVLGDIDMVAFAAAVGMGARVSTGEFLLEIGPRIEGGPVWVAGRPSGPGILAAASVEPILILSVSGALTVRAAPVLLLGIGVDLGWTVLGFHALAEDRAASGMSGPTGSLELTIQLAD